MTAKAQTGNMLAAVNNAPIPFLVTGTASDPVIWLDVKAVVSKNAKGAGTKAAQGLLDRLPGGQEVSPLNLNGRVVLPDECE
jgi:hypothetical protein